MKKINHILGLAIILSVMFFYSTSCERPEIKPDNYEESEISEIISVTYPADRLVGTWVRYNETWKDTLRFSENGTMIYTLGGYHSDGSVYIDQYFYECTDNYLINYNNNGICDYLPQLHYVEFNENNTLLKLGTFTFLPADVAMVYSVLFKKID